MAYHMPHMHVKGPIEAIDYMSHISELVRRRVRGSDFMGVRVRSLVRVRPTLTYIIYSDSIIYSGDLASKNRAW